MNKKLIVVLGQTATGKTKLAVNLAKEINGEIISADSRQVYRGMDIGTGKDLAEYTIDDAQVPYHLIDIVDPGYEYNVFEFQRDFLAVYKDICARNKQPILCGGTGMYIESILKRYNMVEVPENIELRVSLQGKSREELAAQLKKLANMHNTTDIEDRNRLIRAIEIAEFQKDNPENKFPEIDCIAFGVKMERHIVRDRITKRLKERLESGMIEEVESLLNKGLKPEQLIFYGLEYKYITLYLTKTITYTEMFEKLNIAIHQFSKRQMTWFRRMEKQGIEINWLEGKNMLLNLLDLIKEES